ncbi:DUF2752 domain-containing protein [Pedococcus sp.]|jgi:hypothetical protein|uniref:DUF2752 domain-containing protein n=1 Tax=Pedococcus sp. TaxID=2860345 RepID=UPI002E1452C0|nr:DUF2752 domain-containing protein [Pedococcus sp.]
MSTSILHAAPPALGWGRRTRLPVAVAAAAGAVVGTLAVVDPNQPGHYPTCPFLALTGFYCPGCGSLRAIHDLAHGDLGGAVARNPMAVMAVAGLLVAYAAWTRRLWRGEPRSWVAPPWLLYLMLGAVVAFWVLRNVPGWTWLSPA